MDTVTVITVTRDRPQLLKRAILSVQRQDFLGSIKHLILFDSDDSDTRNFLETLSTNPNLSWESVSLNGEKAHVERVAKLRNFGVIKANSKWICFLDDDNEFSPDHISQLVKLATKKRLRAVYSDLMIRNNDGSPFLGNYDPWIQNPVESKNAYDKLVQLGVFIPLSNITKTNNAMIKPGDITWAVDMGTWLLLRDLLLEIPFCEEYTKEDLETNVGEDEKLSWDLIRKKEPMDCTGKPTLIYYLGGFSNTFSQYLNSV